MVGPPRPGRFVIRLGDTPGDPLAAEPIADALVVPGRTFGLHAVSPGGGRYGRPGGRATISYDQAAQTLTVTVTAYGLNSGPHAAHIHLGGCQNQGAVKYMLADFTDARGNLINQTRTVTGVASSSTAGGWYLNLHQGGMNATPTVHFRPLLCANVTSIATTGPTMPSVPATASPAPSTPTATATMPTPTMPTSTSTTPGTGGNPSPNPTDRPTHW